MTEFLTTRQLQDLLRVDRTTIYRMAESGRLPGVKVGKQWRFARDQIETWLEMHASGLKDNGSLGSAARSVPDLRQIMPLGCVQIVQDSFAELLGVMMLVTDLEGIPLTRPSNPCGLYLATESSPAAHRRCLETWAEMARDPSLTPRFRPTPLGLLCARGLIRVGDTIQAMVVVGGIAPPDWPPSADDVARMAATLQLERSLLERHLDQVHRLSPQEQSKVLAYVQRIADIFAHIANERLILFERLQRIAEITQM
ncbi:MAG: PocR ligand-binding domain-containing protein [Anaerolineae bacterium]|nr:PocR ligand-binding domain-containing protein [Caldilineales bacterium]MDW8270345.1 PocR ligand-binding domain-containing protein [Anaerolineae bacterium]